MTNASTAFWQLTGLLSALTYDKIYGEGDMEKRGIVRRGTTPDVENKLQEDSTSDKQAAAADELAKIIALDADFRLRAAETVVNTNKGKK